MNYISNLIFRCLSLSPSEGVPVDLRRLVPKPPLGGGLFIVNAPALNTPNPVGVTCRKLSHLWERGPLHAIISPDPESSNDAHTP